MPSLCDDRLAQLIPWMRRCAASRDETASFPDAEIAALRETGALAFDLPIEQGGRAEVIDRLAVLLMQLGASNLSVGRIVEAHINARHLIARFGTRAQRDRTGHDVRAGHLFALWVTDPPADGLRMVRARDGIRLKGSKEFCSAAGFATRALVTARDEHDDARMLVVSLGNGEQVQPLAAPLQGMRAAVTGTVDFTGCIADFALGDPRDYLREPDFSAGAWRGSAVAAGGLRSLVELAIEQLNATRRFDSPHHVQRMGSATITCETARMWVRSVARIAEDPRADPGQAVAYTGLARIAVETACLDAMPLVQRSLGLSAFRFGNPVERICRDLGTYLRQPAPDEVLTQAATHFARPGGVNLLWETPLAS